MLLTSLNLIEFLQCCILYVDPYPKPQANYSPTHSRILDNSVTKNFLFAVV